MGSIDGYVFTTVMMISYTRGKLCDNVITYNIVW